MKIKPLYDRVVILRNDGERKSAGGILIADTAVEKPDQGEVVAVGNGKIGDDGKMRPMNVKVGDKVLFGKYSGQAFKMEGKEYLQMNEDDLIGIIES